MIVWSIELVTVVGPWPEYVTLG